MDRQAEPMSGTKAGAHGTPSAGDVPDWLASRATTMPHRPALVTHGVRLSFGDLNRLAGRTARQLAAAGVGEGARVALLARNGAAFAVVTHALARLGAVLVPLNTRLAPAELAWQIEDARTALLVSDEALVPLAAEAVRWGRAPERIIAARDGLLHRWDGRDDAPGAARGDSADDAPGAVPIPEREVPLRDRLDLGAVQGIIYTSATSGRPKGVMLTFGNHWWSAVASALNLGLHADDAWLCPLPLYHVGGLAILWRSVIYGIPAVLHETFDPAMVNREIDGGGVTIASVVGTMLRRMLDERGARAFPTSLRCVLLGGGPAPISLLEECVRRRVPIATTYGLTEAASQVATMPPAEAARKPGSAGRPLFPTELRIGSSLPPGEVGEILVRGPTVMLGYADRPDETARALRDGWLHTGDLGYLDDEGCLYVVDRRDDLIISGGENIYPAEVEAILAQHPAVEDAGVVGLPDPQWGQVAVAAVKLRPGGHATQDEITAFCAGRLARYKVPTRVLYVEDLPRSPAGKLLRRAVLEQVSAAVEAVPEALVVPLPVQRGWVREAFHTIAGRYDLLNHVLSGGIHILWKRAAARAAALEAGDVAVDVCCGTADMLVLMARRLGQRGRVIGVDFAPGMLEVARRRLGRRLGHGRPALALSLVCGDAEALPLAEATAHAVTFAFGLRNVAHPERALREAHRVLRPGGRLVILEFGRPRSRLVRALYDLYSKTVIPRLGGWLSGRRDAYQYLHDSIRQWADPGSLAALIRQAGFPDVRFTLLSGGIAVLHTAVRPRGP